MTGGAVPERPAEPDVPARAGGDGRSGGREAGGAERPEGPWTTLALVRRSAEWLEQRGVSQARLDAEHLLAHALGTTRLELYLQHERPLAADELAAFKALLLRRGRREPLQHVVGRAAFRDLDLRVDARVLVPRPETEELVDVVLAWARGRSGLSALDLGTGSGCIALSLAHEGPFDRVIATDASADALDVAGLNAAAIEAGRRIELREGSLFEPVRGETFDVIVSNPPYVAEGYRSALEPEVRDFEPASALFAGPEGLDILKPLTAGAPEHLVPGGLLALEVGLGQADEVAAFVRATGAFDEPSVRRDLSGRRRIVVADRR